VCMCKRACVYKYVPNPNSFFVSLNFFGFLKPTRTRKKYVTTFSMNIYTHMRGQIFDYIQKFSNTPYLCIVNVHMLIPHVIKNSHAPMCVCVHTEMYVYIQIHTQILEYPSVLWIYTHSTSMDNMYKYIQIHSPTLVYIIHIIRH